jgi:hypothetical protein
MILYIVSIVKSSSEVLSKDSTQGLEKFPINGHEWHIWHFVPGAGYAPTFPIRHMKKAGYNRSIQLAF